MSNKLINPSVLAFERKLAPSDATFSAGSWNAIANADNWVPIKNREKAVLGTASHYIPPKGKGDSINQDMKFESPNPQTVDVATLPADADTLKVQFTLRVLGGTGTPSACNEEAYRQKLLATVAGYVDKEGFKEVAGRYSANLANGRFLWRNRIGAENIEVIVAQLRDGKAAKQWTFNALTHDLHTLKAPASEQAALAELATVISEGLAGNSHVLLQVTAFVRVGEGQEVFPSQELILDKGASIKSKTLYDVAGVAAIHSQKIGNALRTIDTWYEGAEENGPIAVEPYGSVTTRAKAYRDPKTGQDFYSLLENWVLKDQAPPTEQQHFVIATLVRGGVFGRADKGKSKAEKDND